MKNILLIGVGGTGSKAVDIFFQKCNELGNQTGNNITALVFDTDAGDLKKIQAAKTVAMADNASVGTICDRFGKEYLREWFPIDDKAVRAQEMFRGASQWRKKSYLAFLNLMNKPLARSTFISALEEMTADPGASCEIYVIASVAGGTGSGSFIPIALYAKRYLRKTLGKDPVVNAMIALPDIYADSQTDENKVKVYANAYAILRELNAINLVARNYNAGVALQKKAPIRFKIGDAREPNVGLLFDASDKQFWTPEAAPFSQVFLLDRIPGLKSVTAHDIVLANSLYTILCTDIGTAFDSEFSNHELLRSQSNGSNAIFAGVSTAQIRFPKESVLDYLAHMKTLKACENEWVSLHNATEAAIREKEREAKECHLSFALKGYDYPMLLLDKLYEMESSNNDSIISIVQRCLEHKDVDLDGNEIETDVVQTYMEDINNFITDRLGNMNAVEKEITTKLDLLAKKGAKISDIPVCLKQVYNILLQYYCQCITNIRRMSGSTADAILTLDPSKADYIGSANSLTQRLLKYNDKYVHPVAELILLCRVRMAIQEKLDQECAKTEWSDLKVRTVEKMPDAMLEVSQSGNTTFSGSAYRSGGKNRFSAMVKDDGKKYRENKRSNTSDDIKQIKDDAKTIRERIYLGALSQFKARVYGAVAASLDILIGKYRNFFNRFIKEKEELVELVKTAHRKDAENVDSVINVYASMPQKEAIYKKVIENAGPITDAELIETDHVVGQSVFKTVLNAAMAEYAKNTSWNDKDSKVYNSLFHEMINAYRESIRKSDAFEELAAYNVIEAIMASCGENADQNQREDEFKTKFAVAQDVATPSLMLDDSDEADDLVKPSNIMVFMMSVGTAKYIKKHAEDFGLHLPADQTSEERVLQSCAEEFIRNYSGNNGARVSIVSSMSDQVLYCTGEIMDITPLRIAKFNELGDGNLYFRNYTIAINNCKKYGTDMWNPHLGNNLHKRGYLPYMNEKKERECDVKVVKALLFGFQSGRIQYKNGIGEAADKFYFHCDGRKITDADGRWVNDKSIAQIFTWIRNEDEIVEAWSALFDREIQRQLNALPSLAGGSAQEFQRLESGLTLSPFMRILTNKLYADPSSKENRNHKDKTADQSGPTALEFAYKIKTSEEVTRDCDDAERILAVLYDTFYQMCAYRTTPDDTPDFFIQVYRQQLSKVYEAVASCQMVTDAKNCGKDRFMQIATWLNKNGVFKTIAQDRSTDDQGKVCIDQDIRIEDYEYFKKPNKGTDAEPADTAASDEDDLI